MTALWTVVSVGVLFTFAKGIGWWRARMAPADIGYVSRQWIAEQRLSQEQVNR